MRVPEGISFGKWLLYPQQVDMWIIVRDKLIYRNCHAYVMSTHLADFDHWSPLIHQDVSLHGDIHHFLCFIHDFIPALSTGMMG
jgi:hypothetical protein